MKEFKFELERVFAYKQNVLDNKRLLYRQALEEFREKEREIDRLKEENLHVGRQFDQTKKAGGTRQQYIFYGLCLSSMEERIKKAERKQCHLFKALSQTKEAMRDAQIEVKKYEKLKEHRLEAYRLKENRAQERFIEEFVSRAPGNKGHI